MQCLPCTQQSFAHLDEPVREKALSEVPVTAQHAGVVHANARQEQLLELTVAGPAAAAAAAVNCDTHS
jgi:hypothetical protein